MKYRLRYTLDAIQDIESAFEWYEEERIGLGKEFLIEVKNISWLISKHPRLFPDVRAGIFRARIDRFPFLIYFKIIKKDILIGAVFHTSRNPKVWKQRSF